MNRMERILLIQYWVIRHKKVSRCVSHGVTGEMFVVTCEKLPGTGDVEETIIMFVLTVSRRKGRNKTEGTKALDQIPGSP